jgi:hypothetical protein
MISKAVRRSGRACQFLQSKRQPKESLCLLKSVTVQWVKVIANRIEFAKRYGFRLRFYHKGLCAIFDKAVFQFQKRRQLFIHAHNETLSVPPWTSTALVYSCSSWENALLD